MPSKLPIIKANTSDENIAKMKVIAEANKRSVAKELEWLIERHIKEYENEHGEIAIKKSKGKVKEWAEMATDKNIPLAERMKASYQTGKDWTNEAFDKLEKKNE